MHDCLELKNNLKKEKKRKRETCGRVFENHVLIKELINPTIIYEDNKFFLAMPASIFYTKLKV